MANINQLIELRRLKYCTLIRFSNPEKRNQLSLTVLNELEEILVSIPVNENLVFTGSGNTFASGANLNEIAELGAESAPDFARRGQSLFTQLRNRVGLTIAAIDGYCMGGGLDLALSCKRRIASPLSEFAHPGVNLGIITGWGGTQLLPLLIGEGRALDLLFTARGVSADEALRIGLIDEISPEPLNAALGQLKALS